MSIQYIQFPDNNKAVELTKSVYSKYKHGGGNEFIKNNLGFVAYDSDKNDKLVGHVFVNNSKDKGFIFNLEVMKEYRNRGIGTKLLDLAVKKLGGYDLTVKKNNETAISIYEKYGFKLVRVTPKGELYMKLESNSIKEEKIMSSKWNYKYIVLESDDEEKKDKEDDKKDDDKDETTSKDNKKDSDDDDKEKESKKKKDDDDDDDDDEKKKEDHDDDDSEDSEKKKNKLKYDIDLDDDDAEDYTSDDFDSDDQEDNELQLSISGDPDIDNAEPEPVSEDHPHIIAAYAIAILRNNFLHIKTHYIGSLIREDIRRYFYDIEDMVGCVADFCSDENINLDNLSNAKDHCAQLPIEKELQYNDQQACNAVVSNISTVLDILDRATTDSNPKHYTVTFINEKLIIPLVKILSTFKKSSASINAVNASNIVSNKTPINDVEIQ